MNKLTKIVFTTLLCVSTAVAAGCGGNADDKKDGAIKIGVTPGPHAMIMDNVQKLAAEKGLKIELLEFSDYVTPNTALAQGELWGNCYQHEPYLKATLKKEPNFDLVKAFNTALFPINVYSKTIKPGETIPNGAKIAIPNDPSNGSRAILMLANNNLIKVKNINDMDTTLGDIVENPHNFKFIELEAATIPRSLDDVDCAAINTNYALAAGMNPAKESIVRETSESFYVNIFAVRKAMLNDPKLKQLQAIYQSKENAEFIHKTFPGSVEIGWKE